MKKRSGILILLFGLFCSGMTYAQISPGELANAHAHLEGMSNCTHCHSLGAKVANEKCLACHLELKARTDLKKGYHASAEIAGKNCITCHSDHHGRTFQLIRFSKEKFDHNLTGFRLTGVHAKKGCADCHKAEFIGSKTIRGKKFTYLGLTPSCIGCHADYHQKSLPEDCSQCHDALAFKPAAKFSHTLAKYQLTGKHQSVPCLSCHKITTRDGKKFQQFTGLQFKSCADCHADPHHNQFGPNCAGCHSNESFHAVKGIPNFDHSKTAFKLEDKHLAVPCKSCHKNNITDPIKHAHCTDCHQDYHRGQFIREGVVTDCSACHTTRGFPGSSFTIEQHNNGNFKLSGAHLATPCIACHKKQEKWNFRQIGIHCIDCHANIHENFLDAKYYPENDCERCHNMEAWSQIRFDHGITAFPLSGTHARQSCRTCHFRKNADGKVVQQFAGLSSGCTNCHTDTHYRQFETDGVTRCLRCHAPDSWKIGKFDHNTTAFKLDGQHEKVPCAKCHKLVTQDQHSFVLYKNKKTRCENCH